MAYNPDEARDESGKWTAGGGGASDSLQGTIDKVSRDLGYEGTIAVSNETKTFALNGQTMNYAGSAQLDSGQITIYTNQVSSTTAAGVIAHEIEHVKFQNALDSYRSESSHIPPGEIRADGSLRPGLAGAVFPNYTAMHEALFKHGMDAFAASDGVSDYSYEYWKGWKEGKIGTELALHETLAEMARIKYTTGSFPEHYGERILAYRGVDTPKPSAAKMQEGARRWRELYRTVESVHKRSKK